MINTPARGAVAPSKLFISRSNDPIGRLDAVVAAGSATLWRVRFGAEEVENVIRKILLSGITLQRNFFCGELMMKPKVENRVGGLGDSLSPEDNFGYKPLKVFTDGLIKHQ